MFGHSFVLSLSRRRRSDGDPRPLKHFGDGGAVGRTPSGAGIPAGTGRIAGASAGSVVTVHNVVEGSGGGRLAVEKRIDEAQGSAGLLRGEGEQTGPQRGDGAGTSNDGVLAIDANVVAGIGIGIAGDIGHAAASLIGRAD